MAHVIRRAAKVLLVTGDLEVLLFSSQHPGDPHRVPHWFAVGGGLEADETDEEAAVRETAEETGLVLSVADLGSPTCRCHVSFEFDGDLIDQDETYFIVRAERFEPDTEGWTEVERRAMATHRWWSLDELRATDHVVYPEGLVELLEGLQAQ